MGSKVLVEGASGYAGQEVVDRLQAHPEIDEVIAGSHEALDEDALHEVDFAISALPSGVSAARVASLHRMGKWVADLSGDLRLKTVTDYERWYHPKKHQAPELLERSAEIPLVVSELAPSDTAEHDLVSITGCYSGASIAGLAPLTCAGLLVTGETARINAISGVSGMGKAKKAEADEILRNREVKIYKGGRHHQHVPEIERCLDGRKVFFVPSVGPYFRGIQARIDVTLKRNIYPKDAQEVLETAYGDYPHMRVLPLGSDPPTKTDTAGTDNCHMSILADNRELQVVVSIDNLGRGAAAGGIMELNRRLGVPLATGLCIKSDQETRRQ